MFVQLMDIRNGELKDTGIGAEWETPEQTKQAFESLRPYHLEEGAEFLVDLYENDHDIVDTIGISKKMAEHLVGETL